MTKHPLSYFMRLGVFSCVLLAAVGCENMRSDQTRPAASGPSYIQWASIAPPAPRDEIAPVIESPETQLWRPGHWEEGGLSGFDWVSGDVIARPSPTAVWSPSYWALREYGWVYIPGYWY